MTEHTEAQAIIETARLSTEPHEVEPGGLYVVPTAHGHTVVDLTGDEYATWPRRKTGITSVDDVASFAQYYAKHRDDASEVFADIARASIIAVLDAHGTDDLADIAAAGDGARWQGHRLTLALAKTPEWTAWTGKNTQMMPQNTFAEFLEDHIADIAADGPCTAADLLEMAQHFQATNRVAFKSGRRLESGETRFEYAETIEAKAGQRGDITIPTAFELGIRVFDDSEPYRVKARFRYRLNDGALTLGYHLDDPERKFRDAVLQVVAKAEEACGVKIMRGRPS